MDFGPHKPHPFGNEYHIACCASSSNMFSLELVEDQDRPRAIGTLEFNEQGKTCGLLLCILKSYIGSGMYVILDSGFCVLKRLVELHRCGLFGCALIKKHQYWPTHVLGDDIDWQMLERAVGETDTIQDSLEGMQYNIWVMKDVGYTMKMMATGGDLVSDDLCRTTI